MSRRYPIFSHPSTLFPDISEDSSTTSLASYPAEDLEPEAEGRRLSDHKVEVASVRVSRRETHHEVSGFVSVEPGGRRPEATTFPEEETMSVRSVHDLDSLRRRSAMMSWRSF